MAKRRFQKGCFQLKDGKAYTFYYEDSQQTDGALGSRKVRHLIGCVGSGAGEMSERAARREHARIMEEVNRKRGSVAPAVRGETFQDAVTAWRTAVAPNLSPSTVRQRESYLRKHILPRFKDAAPHSLDVGNIQQFATDLHKKTLARKTVINVLQTMFRILDYAERTGIRVSKVSLSDIHTGSETQKPRAPFFTREQIMLILAEAKEPYQTMFAVAWITGLRAGELLALNVADLDFAGKTIYVNKSADDYTREIRHPKTPKSTAVLPMPSALEAVLKDYLEHRWKPNPLGLLFPNRRGTRPRLRDNVVKYGLKPLLKKLGIPSHRVGLHAIRHGLATELAESAVPIPVLQQQMRHADVKTTLRVYAHVLPQSQRDAVERVGQRSISTLVPIGTDLKTQTVCAE